MTTAHFKKKIPEKMRESDDSYVINSPGCFYITFNSSNPINIPH